MRTRVETEGSIWLLDDDLGRYCRMPKHEGPRWSPPGEDWGGPNGEPGLQDLVWHPMTSWSIFDHHRKDWLCINRPGGEPNIYAPLPVILSG